MSAQFIPMGQVAPWYDMQVVLSGIRYTLEVRYNTRMDRWMLAVADANNVPIVCGIPLLIGRDLLGQYATLSLPPQLMVVADLSGKNLQPGLSDFLKNHVLAYVDRTTA